MQLHSEEPLFSDTACSGLLPLPFSLQWQKAETLVPPQLPRIFMKKPHAAGETHTEHVTCSNLPVPVLFLWLRIWRGFWLQKGGLVVHRGLGPLVVHMRGSWWRRPSQLQFHSHLWPRLCQSEPLQLSLFKGGNAFCFPELSFVSGGNRTEEQGTSHAATKGHRRSLLEYTPVQVRFLLWSVASGLLAHQVLAGKRRGSGMRRPGDPLKNVVNFEVWN